ncbi:hypothetical protein Tco_0165920, partial [Tanacetum coccineum]
DPEEDDDEDPEEDEVDEDDEEDPKEDDEDPDEEEMEIDDEMDNPERYNTEIKIKKKFNEDDLRMKRHELDVIIKYSKMKRPCIPKRLRAPRADDPYVMARDAAMAAQEEDDDDVAAAKDPQPSESRGSLRDQ